MKTIRRRHFSVGVHKLILGLIDIAILTAISFVMLWLNPSGGSLLAAGSIALHILIAIVCVSLWRAVLKIYDQVWRYISSTAYLRLIGSDFFGGITYYVLQLLLAGKLEAISFVRLVSIIATNLVATIIIRFIYQTLYEYKGSNKLIQAIRVVTSPITGFSSGKSDTELDKKSRKIRIAIVGAGRVGVGLADDLIANSMAAYEPVCFIDIDNEKVGRSIKGIPVLAEKEATKEALESLNVQEIVFALPKMEAEKKMELYKEYKKFGCKVKVYDYPIAQTIEKGKRHVREFDIEELLFRKAKQFLDEKAKQYYKGKTVLITGGGGSIGSELGRQLAKMELKKLIILDVYENCAYDLQQELKIAYGDKIDLAVEIVTITDIEQLEKVFDKYRPQVVLHAAAHKHVPLMEHNCVEAVKNNVFGTWNVVECCEKYGVEKAVMVSTDKAVNPTNVMGATKRMCEMIFQSRVDSKTSFSCTRFGNVLGSNGSVIPLFKRQIANGGPVTLTDKRIIRYFMTIPEASQLVLNSGAMAKHGDLFVLDMGKPVRILELAENMIKLSGYEPYKDIEIIETGLRPGEKLYEELLIKTEELDKTENSMIFIEHDSPLNRTAILEKMDVLKEAVKTVDDDAVRLAMKKVVPTFHSPKHVNAKAEEAEEMQRVAG